MNKPYVLVGRAEAAGADVAVIADVPDNVRAVAASLIVNATGAVKLKTTVPLTPLEMAAAAKNKPLIARLGSKRLQVPTEGQLPRRVARSSHPALTILNRRSPYTDCVRGK